MVSTIIISRMVLVYGVSNAFLKDGVSHSVGNADISSTVVG